MVDENVTKEQLFNNMSELKNMLLKLKNTLDIGVLNVNRQIKDIIILMRKVGKQKSNIIDLSQDDNRKFEMDYSKSKEDLKRFKSFHIVKYNEKIIEIRRRFSLIEKRNAGSYYSEDIKKLLKEVPLLTTCNLLKENSAWTDNRYLNTLEYDNIEYAELKIGEVESMLNIKDSNEINNITDIVSEINNIVNEMETNIKGDLTVQEIDKYLFECGTLFGRLIILGNEYEKIKVKISQSDITNFNTIILSLDNRLNNIRELLIAKRKNVCNENIYSSLMNEFDALERDYTELVESFFEDEGKCTKRLIARYQNNLEKLNKRFDIINKRKYEYFKEEKIDVQQLSNLKERCVIIASIHSEFTEKINNEPFIIDERSSDDEYFTTIDKDLNEIKKVISNLGSEYFKNMTEIKNVQKRINDLGNSLNVLNTSIYPCASVSIDSLSFISRSIVI